MEKYSKETAKEVTSKGYEGLKQLESFIDTPEHLKLNLLPPKENTNITWKVIDDKFIENMKECPFAKAIDSNELAKKCIGTYSSELVKVNPMSPPDIDLLARMTMDVVYEGENENENKDKKRNDCDGL